MSGTPTSVMIFARRFIGSVLSNPDGYDKPFHITYRILYLSYGLCRSAMVIRLILESFPIIYEDDAIVKSPILNLYRIVHIFLYSEQKINENCFAGNKFRMKKYCGISAAVCDKITVRRQFFDASIRGPFRRG